MTFTQDQIEAEALDLFEMREAGQARRWGVGYVRGKFAGQERDFCLAAAKYQLEMAEYQRQQEQAVIDTMAHISGADLRRVIASIEQRRAQPFYFIATNSRDEERDYADLTRYRAELARRAALTNFNDIPVMEAAE